MAGTTRQDIMAGLGAGSQAFSKLTRKIVLLASEDSLVLSHCRALVGVLTELAREVVVVTRSSGRLGEIEALGTSVIDFDGRASWSNPAQDAATAWKLARILEPEGADVTHLLGVKPATLGCLALKLVAAKHVVMHLPDLDALEPASSEQRWFYRPTAMKLIASQVRKPNSFLLVEDPDDLADLRARGAEPSARFAVLGGAGVDPEVYPVLPHSQSETPIAAYVGPMTKSAGVEVLMRAFDRVWARGVRLHLELIGEPATEGDDSVSAQDLAQWALHPGVSLPGPVADVREVWRRAEICVLPGLGRQGTPRTLVEAAACSRALVVSERAGGRNFVRDGVEGLVVPPADIAALAEALERLARDGELRERLGEGARLRVLHGYTEAHVKEALRGAYLSLLGNQALPRS